MSPPAPNTLDVRPLPPRRTSPTVLAAFDQLAPGESFVLVDDGDPARLRQRMEAERPGEARWVALREGPRVWHIEITRRRSGADGDAAT